MGATDGGAAGPPAGDDAALKTLLSQGGFARALNLEPADLRIGLRIAQNHRERGDLTEALRLYGMLVLCDPMNADFQRGLAQCGLAAGQFALAVQAASALIASDPRSPVGYLVSGLGCAGLGERDAAREDLETAQRLAREAGDASIASAAESALAALVERPAAA